MLVRQVMRDTVVIELIACINALPHKGKRNYAKDILQDEIYLN